MAIATSQLQNTYVEGIAGLKALWADTLGDPEICIAVLDGPVDYAQASLTTATVTQRQTLVPCGANRGPATAHGTQIASVIFGQHNSSVKGIAPQERAINYAATNPLRVWKMALSESLCSIGKIGPDLVFAERQKSLDCDKVVRAGVRFGINSAWAGCLRALCARINCKYYDDCGGTGLFEHNQRVDNFSACVPFETGALLGAPPIPNIKREICLITQVTRQVVLAGLSG